ncbi:hypothetical protein [Kitasatospora purpeofusca]|nr:hypothetical protein [Kitasatospora purpeofusca]MDY0812275.1 hypothetical protein [Kitasatospora purpeofusca]
MPQKRRPPQKGLNCTRLPQAKKPWGATNVFHRAQSVTLTS